MIQISGFLKRDFNLIYRVMLNKSLQCGDNKNNQLNNV